MYKNFVMANEYQSSKLCEARYTECEDKMDQLQVLKLPSMAKFNAGFLLCNQSFEQECVGPSKSSYEHRMMKVGLLMIAFSFSFHQMCFFSLSIQSIPMLLWGNWKPLVLEPVYWLFLSANQWPTPTVYFWKVYVRKFETVSKHEMNKIREWLFHRFFSKNYCFQCLTCLTLRQSIRISMC